MTEHRRYLHQFVTVHQQLAMIPHLGVWYPDTWKPLFHQQPQYVFASRRSVFCFRTYAPAGKTPNRATYCWLSICGSRSTFFGYGVSAALQPRFSTWR
jgi:hypothetical protein